MSSDLLDKLDTLSYEDKLEYLKYCRVSVPISWEDHAIIYLNDLYKLEYETQLSHLDELKKSEIKSTFNKKLFTNISRDFLKVVKSKKKQDDMDLLRFYKLSIDIIESVSANLLSKGSQYYWLVEFVVKTCKEKKLQEVMNEDYFTEVVNKVIPHMWGEKDEFKYMLFEQKVKYLSEESITKILSDYSHDSDYLEGLIQHYGVTKDTLEKYLCVFEKQKESRNVVTLMKYLYNLPLFEKHRGLNDISFISDIYRKILDGENIKDYLFKKKDFKNIMYLYLDYPEILNLKDDKEKTHELLNYAVGEGVDNKDYYDPVYDFKKAALSLLKDLEINAPKFTYIENHYLEVKLLEKVYKGESFVPFLLDLICFKELELIYEHNNELINQGEYQTLYLDYEDKFSNLNTDIEEEEFLNLLLSSSNFERNIVLQKLRRPNSKIRKEKFMNYFYHLNRVGVELMKTKFKAYNETYYNPYYTLRNDFSKLEQGFFDSIEYAKEISQEHANLVFKVFVSSISEMLKLGNSNHVLDSFVKDTIIRRKTMEIVNSDLYEEMVLKKGLEGDNIFSPYILTFLKRGIDVTVPKKYFFNVARKNEGEFRELLKYYKIPDDWFEEVFKMTEKHSCKMASNYLLANRYNLPDLHFLYYDCHIEYKIYQLMIKGEDVTEYLCDNQLNDILKDIYKRNSKILDLNNPKLKKVLKLK